MISDGFARTMAIPAAAALVAGVALTPVVAPRPGIEAPVSLSGATDVIDGGSALAALPEAFDADPGSASSGIIDAIEGFEELVHYPLELVEWVVGFVPFIGGVLVGELEAFWNLAVDLINAPLFNAIEVLTGDVGLGEGLANFGDDVASAFTDFFHGVIDPIIDWGPPLPPGLAAEPGEFAAGADAGDGLDLGALLDSPF